MRAMFFISQFLFDTLVIQCYTSLYGETLNNHYTHLKNINDLNVYDF